MLDNLLEKNISSKLEQIKSREEGDQNTIEDNVLDDEKKTDINIDEKDELDEEKEDELIDDKNIEDKEENIEENNEGEDKGKDEKIEEIIKRMQAEADRRVNEALEKERKKAEREKELAAMDEKERYEALLKEREEEIRKKEYEIEKLEVVSMVKSKMNSNGLGELVDIINVESYIGKDKEEIENSLDEVVDKIGGLIKNKLTEEKKNLLGNKGRKPDNSRKVKKVNKSNLDSFLDNLKL